jgi:hypothetical protein
MMTRNRAYSIGHLLISFITFVKNSGYFMSFVSFCCILLIYFLCEQSNITWSTMAMYDCRQKDFKTKLASSKTHNGVRSEEEDGLFSIAFCWIWTDEI